eukprot:14967096-Heterocapsa_arctica.AAC.1
MLKLGWKDNTPTNIIDHKNQSRDLGDWHDFVYDGIERARQQAWEKSATDRPNCKGVETGVDEATTRKVYQQLAQKNTMKAGALHTILDDGVWTPRRSHKREKNRNGDCLLCGEKNAGVNHLWWECRTLNRHSYFCYLKLMKIRQRAQPIR